MADNKKLLQKVQFTPADAVKFDGKLEEFQRQQVTITNTTDTIVTFKCKGTSPEQIKIRPGYGYLNPNEKATITIAVDALNTRPRPPTNERLVVLLATASNDRPGNPMQMWRGGTVPGDPKRVVLPLKFTGVSKIAQEVIAQSGEQTLDLTKK